MKTFKTTTGRTIARVSRYIKIRTDYVTSRHSLYDYADSSSEEDGKRLLDYFIYHGKKYALNQFMRLGSNFIPEVYQFEENGKTQFLSGVDSENYYNPLLIEVDEYGESVRIYEEIAAQEGIMKDFTKMNKRYLQLRRWLPMKLAYKLTIMLQEVE